MMRVIIIVGSLLCMGWVFSPPLAWNGLPSDFPTPRYDFSKNPYNPGMITLGRLLFYDPRLSADSTISCASCHSPYNAFAHTDHAVSHGIHDSIGFRNAPALFNLAWHPSMMWDGAIHHLDVQPLAPLEAKNEMASNLNLVLRRLNNDSFYKKYCVEAFGDSIMHGEQFLKALAQFQLSLISDQSRYDSMRRKQIKFTLQEKNGYRLFKQHCNACHQEPLFSTYQFAQHRIPFDSLLHDIGRARITHNQADSGLFKIPSLRNLAFTFPYMHDGRYKRIRDVIKQYAETAGNKRRTFALNEQQQTDLLAFLLTLTDRHFVFDTTHTFPKVLRKEIEGN